MAATGSLESFTRFLRTIAHLRPVQFCDRVRRQVAPAKPDLRPAPALRPIIGSFAVPCTRQRRLYDHWFRVLNVERRIDHASAWNDARASKLWLYNLHYFDDLIAEDAASRRSDLDAFITRWIVENPPGVGNGWEPYPNALRIVNWIKWSLLGGTLSTTALDSLAVQVRYLSHSLEYHLLANHLFADAKALVFAGLFFDGPEADTWLRKGRGILAHELPEQVLADGGHFELSPTYHAIITEDVLDLVNLAAAYNRPDRFRSRAIAGRMLDWLATMTRPDGLPPFFNDAAYGVSPTLSDITRYAGLLGIETPSAAESKFLQASGYARVTTGPAVLFADVGKVGPSYNPGHAHCDMLSFELAVDGRPVFVNTGTSTYDAGVRRMQERGTAAHNTVQIEDAEQSEIWGAFRVGRRAHPHLIEIGEDRLEASHDGFAPLGVCHTRRFSWTDNQIVIEDTCSGSDRRATARFHLHPDILPVRDGGAIALGPGRISFAGAEDVSVTDYEYAPEFNRRILSKMIVVQFNWRLKTAIAL